MEKMKTDPSGIFKEENQGKLFPFLELNWKGKTLWFFGVFFVFLLKEGDLYSSFSYLGNYRVFSSSAQCEHLCNAN